MGSLDEFRGVIIRIFSSTFIYLSAKNESSGTSKSTAEE